jgi:hypothetical protein
MVPQVDRVCITTVEDGKLKELLGPMSGRMHRREQKGEEEVKKVIDTAKKDASKGAEMPENMFSPLPTVDAQGESLAEYAAGTKVVVNGDLSKAKGKMVEAMIKRGAKSSMHVPAEIKGARVTINFWSTDPDAFTPPAQALLTGVSQILTAPKDKDNAQAAAK